MAKKDEKTKTDDNVGKPDTSKKDETQDVKASGQAGAFVDEKTLDTKLDAFFERVISFVKKHPGKPTEAANEVVRGADPLHIGEIGNQGPIERMSENDFVEQAELSKFMNDILTIVVHPDNTEGSYDVVTPNVNSINQPIIRGKESKVKRKYVEALARSRTTKYAQQTPDPRKPENIQMLDTTVLTYPFAVLHDPHPHGREWLQAILAQR